MRKIIQIENVLDKLSDWYWEQDRQKLAEDPCVVDAMINMFIRLIREEPEIQFDNLNRDKGTWVKMSGVVTPGGDPAYKCSNCGGGIHINGVEHREHWEYCPDCGSHNGDEYEKNNND